jgi:hypothetical protein
MIQTRFGGFFLLGQTPVSLSDGKPDDYADGYRKPLRHRGHPPPPARSAGARKLPRCIAGIDRRLAT